jgi:hypothetical protein
MVTEQLPKLVEEQVKAISNLKIDSITVWEGGKGKDDKGSTADFLSSLIGALPPLQELTRNAGIRLPEFLGKALDDAANASSVAVEPRLKPESIETAPQKVRKCLVGHKPLLRAFDSNEDGQIDDREVDSALTMTLQWASVVKTNSNAKWFIASAGNAVGPKTWKELESLSKVQELLISLENTDFWLPFEAVDLARQS